MKGNPIAATLFSGDGGADVGLAQAGFTVRWGIERDDEIAGIARANGHPVRTADVLLCDPADFEAVDLLHASPPCPSFSVAKTGGGETEDDLMLARKVTEFVATLRPRLFTLENVWGYRTSRSWRIIQNALTRAGYAWAAWHLNAADYGAPQTRQRMIVAARLGGSRPRRPVATHAETPPAPGLFGDDLPRWRGWYEAIEDLLPTCPDSELAPWQRKRLPDEMRQMLVGAGGYEDRIVSASIDDPAFTVTANTNQSSQIRAVLAMSGNANLTDDRPLLESNQPANTVSGAGGGRALPKALLVESKNMGQERGDGVRLDSEPATSVPTDDRPSHFPRAVLVGCNANDTSGAPIHHSEAQPAPTIRAPGGGRHLRAVVGYRVVQLTPRCLARFQTFPDDYALPENRTLACRIIGNAVPPLLMRRVAESL